MLSALICFLLCGCTREETDHSGSESTLPTVNTERGDFPGDVAASEDKTQPSGPDSTEANSESANSSEPTEGPTEASQGNTAESEEDIDDEVSSEYVAEGGDVVGIGGN